MGLDTIVERDHPEPGVNLTYIQQTGDTHFINDGGDQYVGLDRFGRVLDQNWWNPTSQTSTDRFQYGYDRVGDRLYSNNLVSSAQSELYRANSTQTGDSNTAYDPLGRETAFARGTLSSSGHNGTQLDTVSSASRSQSWSLDALGNWSSVTTNGTATTRGFNAQNQTTSVFGGTAPTYDHNGNTTSDNGLTYVFDAWNRLVAANNGATTVASYAYDALGRRVIETYSGSSTTNHLYYSPQWQVIEERQNGTGTTNVTQQYVWGAAYIDQMVLRDSYSGGVKTQRLYAQQNANFDTAALINTSGQVQERYLYDPYGAVTITDASWTPRTGNTSSFGWQYLHQGGRLDAVTRWYGFRNRDLIPSEGRWAERDPLGFGGGDLNIYRALFNRPQDGSDPSGEGIWDAVASGVQVVGGGAEVAAGVAVGVAVGWTGIGLVPAAVLIAHGSDTALTGASGLYQGQAQKTYTNCFVAKQTGSSIAGDVVDTGIPLVFGAWGSAAAKKAAEKAATQQALRAATKQRVPATKKPPEICPSIPVRAVPKTGDLFERTFETSQGPVGLLAETAVEGDTLILKDLVVYGRGTQPLTGLTREALAARSQLTAECRSMGFKKLRIIAQRLQTSSSGNPGHTIDITLDLTR